MPAPACQGIPEKWPSNLVYLTRPYYSPKVPPSVLTQAERSPPQDFSTAKPSLSPPLPDNLIILPASSISSPSPLVRIAQINDPSHPAHGQHGLFATKHLAADSFILCYLGWTHSGDEADPSSSYDLALDRDLDVAVDATHMGNEARFINDYRGVRPEGANAEFRDVLVRIGKGLVERRVGVFVRPEGKAGGRAKAKNKPRKGQSAGISKGEEIVVSYGKGFWTHYALENGDSSG